MKKMMKSFLLISSLTRSSSSVFPVYAASHQDEPFIQENGGSDILFDEGNRAKNSKAASKYKKKAVLYWYLFEKDGVNLYLTDTALKNYRYVEEHSDHLNGQISKYFQFNLDNKNRVDAFIFGNDSYMITQRQPKYNSDLDLLVLNGDAMRGQDIRYHFVHEMVHAFEERVWGLVKIGESLGFQNTAWLMEGLAEYVAKQKVDYKPAKGAGPLKPTHYGKDEYISQLKELAEQRHIDWEDVGVWTDTQRYGEYFIYESIIYYLATSYGDEVLKAFIGDLADKMAVDEAFKKHFGKSEKQFVSNWKVYFQLSE